MRRTVIGATAGLAIWFGSALAVEAQQITPTGPLSVYAGATSSTLTGTVYLPTPCAYRTRLWVYNGTQEIHYSEMVHANPGTNYSTLNRPASHLVAPKVGDTLRYVLKFKVGTIWYDVTPDYTCSVVSTRPSSKSTVYKPAGLSLQTVDRDRRRE
jgi:hypothetical protein